MAAIAGYARVSTSGQKDQPLDMQIERLRNAGATEIISEVDSGRKDERTKYLKLLQKVKEGLYEGAIFTRIDRLGRNANEILNSVETFKKSGAYIKVLDQNIDTSDPRQDYFLLTIYAGLAQNESDKLSERVRHGWDYTRKLKKAVNPPFGYTVLANKYVFDNEPFICLLEDKPPKGEVFEGRSRYEVAVDAIEIFKAKRSLNSTVREINRKYLYACWQRGRSSKLINDVDINLNYEEDSGKRNKRSRNNLGWSVPGLKKWLLNPVLQGHTKYVVREKGSEPFELFCSNTHTDILVDPELLSKINFYLENNERIANYSKEKQPDRHFLSGTIKCAECKCSYYVVRKDDGVKRNAKYMQCHKARMKECSNNRYIKIADIEAELFGILANAQKGQIEQLRRQREEAEENLKDLEQELSFLNSAPNPNSAGIRLAIDNCEKRIHALKNFVENKIPDPFDPDQAARLQELVRIVDADLNATNTRSYDLLASHIRDLVQFIWVNEGKIIKITVR